jgi:hypothetical protein
VTTNTHPEGQTVSPFIPGPSTAELAKQIQHLRNQLGELVTNVGVALKRQDKAIAEVREALPTKRVPAAEDEMSKKILDAIASTVGLPIQVKFTAATMAETLGHGRDGEARSMVNNRLGQLAKSGKIDSEKVDGHNRTYWAKTPTA